MKKIFLGLAILFIVIGFSFQGAWAWTCDASDCSATSGSLDFRASKNVTIAVNSVAQQYAAVSGHTQGNRKYGVTSESSLVYYTSKDEGTAITDSDAPDDTDSSAFSSWDSL